MSAFTVVFCNHHFPQSEEKALHLSTPLHTLIISVFCLHNSATCSAWRIASCNHGGMWTGISCNARYYVYCPYVMNWFDQSQNKPEVEDRHPHGFYWIMYKTCNEWFLAGSCKDVFIALFLVCYSLIWLRSWNCNTLSLLSPPLVTGAVQANGQIPQIVRRSSTEFPETQKKMDASEAQVSSYYNSLVKCYLWTSSPSLFFFTRCLVPSKSQCAVVTSISPGQRGWFLAVPPHALHTANSAVAQKCRGVGTATCHFSSPE